LLYAAASEVTIEWVRALVRQVGAEPPTIEYKEQMCDTIVRGVAALGNTYGGLLVGVTDDRIVRGIKKKTIESAADHCVLPTVGACMTGWASRPVSRRGSEVARRTRDEHISSRRPRYGHHEQE
jgi:hypothetical protein